MNENPSISAIDLLISKYLSGNTTSHENEEIIHWLEASSDNCNKLAREKAVWLAADSMVNQISSERWEQLQARLSERQTIRASAQEVSQISRRTIRIWRYAAAVLLVVSLSSLSILWFQLKKSEPVAQNTFDVPYGSQSVLTLSDGTRLWINSGSKITYNNRYGKDNRDIYLSGEAYFDVAKNRKVPFIVHTSTLNIKALGTAFNVKAYPEELKVETTLVHGLIEIEKKGSQKIVLLHPSEKIVFSDKIAKQINTKQPEQNKSSLQTKNKETLTENNMVLVKGMDTEKETSWKDGKLIFDREPLSSLTIKLERRYDVHFEFSNPQMKDNVYTGTFNDLSIEQILRAMRLSSPIDFEIKDKLVTLRMKQ